MKRVLFILTLFIFVFVFVGVISKQPDLVLCINKGSEYDLQYANIRHWFSTDSMVAVAEDSVVSGVGKGESAILGVDGFSLKKLDVTVDAPKLSNTSLRLEVGDTESITISGITPETDISVTSNNNLVWVDKTDTGVYNITAKKDGSCNIVFLINDEKFVCNVNVYHDCIEGEPVTTKEVNCYRDGEKSVSCKICNKLLRTEKIPCLGHDYKRSICTRCNDVEYFDKDDHTVVISKVLCDSLGISLSGNVEIPKVVTIDGVQFDAVGIGYALFYNNESLISVSLPDTITYIGSSAFDGCVNLESIKWHEGIKYIGDAAFQICSSLKFLEFPNSVEYLGDFSCNHLSSLSNEIIRLPDSIKSCGKTSKYPAHMFYDCGKDETFKAFEVPPDNQYYTVIDGILYTKDCKTLVSIPRGKTFSETDGVYYMPDTVENLGELSFSRNKFIRRVVISDNLSVDTDYTNEERISYINFGNDLSVGCYGYSNVKEYDVKETNEKYCSVNGVLYTKDMKHLVAVPNHYEGVLSIPEGVEVWNKEAILSMIDYFNGIAMNKITAVEIPSTVLKIDSNQIEILNDIVKLYGTVISVSSENTAYYVDSKGMLCEK